MPGGLSVTPQQWRVLTDAVFPSAKSPESIVLALDYCVARKLDPFKRPVHIVPMWNSSLRREVETIWPGINELQVTAARTGQWAGMDEPKWGKMITRTFHGQTKDGGPREVTLEYPEWCSVTVYRMILGQRSAFTEPVYWDECYARIGRSELPNDMWQKRVRGQLHKNAKAASLRAAFPEEMGNDYSAEEMEGRDIAAGGIVIDGQAEPAHPPEPAVEQPAKPTVTQWLDALAAEMAAAVDMDEVDSILARSDVQKAQDALRNGARDRLDHILQEGIRRTARADDAAEAEAGDQLFADPEADPFRQPVPA